jgi:hypothetical protein
MLYWKYSANRTFFLNEYWILIPTMILANYFTIRKIRSHKKKMKELERLKELVRRYEQERRIMLVAYLACGLTLPYLAGYRGGGTDYTDVIDVDYIDCGIEEGLRFLDNDRLRKIIHDLYKYKRRGKIIYITATAVCHLAHMYGLHFLAFPIAIGDFGLTSVYQTVRKTFVTILLGLVGPILTLGGGGPVSLIFAALAALTGLRLSFMNLDKILTSPIDPTILAEKLKPRIPDNPDVVTVNFRNKMKMSPQISPEKKECWLADQALLNPSCNIGATDIPNAIDLVSHDLKYNEVVNMQDVTGLERVEFSDILDLGQAKSSISKPSTGKTVNFLDKFGDRGAIDEMDTWDISEDKKYLRTRIRIEGAN